MGRSRPRQQGLRDRIAAIADRHRDDHQIAIAGAEDRLGQERRYHRQQWPHHPAQFRRGQFADARRRSSTSCCRSTSIGRANIRSTARSFRWKPISCIERKTARSRWSGCCWRPACRMPRSARSSRPCRPPKSPPSRRMPRSTSTPCFRPSGYYRYPGSLTTPPCSEIVEWLLLTDPIEVAEADVASFAKLYPMNARPVQKDNRRYVLQSS